MNIANALTIARIVLTFAFIGALYQPSPFFKILAAVIFTLAALTDYYDGYFAKTRNLTSNFGKLMDPIADKFLILATFFVFVQMGLIPAWMFVLMFIRETGITVWRLWAMSRGRVLAAEMAGKCKTVVQITAISFVLLFLIFNSLRDTLSWWPGIVNYWYFTIMGLMYLTVFLTIYSGIVFFLNNRKEVHA